LYYWSDGNRLYFASEIKALLRVPGIPRELDASSLNQYLTFLWVPGGRTLLKNIRKVEPGHYLLWTRTGVTTHRWFSLAYEPDYSVGEADWLEQVDATFMRTTRRQMVSEVPLGAFLSGGADSSAITACMRRCFPEREIRCYTVEMDGADIAREGFADDLPYARRVADH